MNFFLSQKYNKGFTLIEMLVAVFIFTISLSSLMIVTTKGVKGTAEASRQITADFLALEAIETVRNIRDNQYLEAIAFAEAGSSVLNPNWDDIFPLCLPVDVNQNVDPVDCGIDTNNSPLQLLSCSSLNGCNIYQSSSGVYSHEDSGTTETPYDRVVHLRYRVSDREASTPVSGDLDVTVTVTWPTGSAQYTNTMSLWLQ